MELEAIKKSLQKFEVARYNLLLIIVITAVNLVLLGLETDTYLLFSASAPYYIYLFGIIDTDISGDPTYTSIGAAIAIAILVVFFVCWILSKRIRIFMPISLILFALDTAYYGWLIAEYGFEASDILDLVFHAWILFYLVVGTIAWTKLSKAGPENISLAQAEMKAPAIPMQQFTPPINEQTANMVMNDFTPQEVANNEVVSEEVVSDETIDKQETSLSEDTANIFGKNPSEPISDEQVEVTNDVSF